MTRYLRTGLTSALAAVVLLGVGWGAEDSATEHAEIAKALVGVKVSLHQGLSAATNAGKPISSKFEVEDGKLLLSVYTEKAGAFSEVVVDHGTGKVTKTEAITEGEDLTHAKAQSEAMGKAKVSLAAAVSKATAANPGFQAVSVFPSLKNGHPVADVSLHKGAEWRTASEKLD